MEKPWYQQFWPWFIMALPASVVVAGLTTVYIAHEGADHLVADDYYKDGLAINRERHKQRLAQDLGLVANVVLTAAAVEVQLNGDQDPAALRLNLSHPMNANLDMEMTLARESAGRYRAALLEPLAYRWHWQLQPIEADPANIWQLDGETSMIAVDETRQQN